MRLWLLFGISFCTLDQEGGYALDLVVVVVEVFENEEDEDEDKEDEEDLVVDAEEEFLVVDELPVVEELPVEVGAADEINELGAPPDNVHVVLKLIPEPSVISKA
jgi:hypothetical protein